MPQITSPQDVTGLGTILGVWAHPDDETYMAGGIIAAATANGQKVFCITGTKGEHGVQDESRWPESELGRIRTKEYEEAQKILGINKNIWLGIEDGKCKAAGTSSNIGAEVRNMISDIKPDTILTFGPDGMTGHLDHQAVSAWATASGFAYDIPVYHAVVTSGAYKLHKDALAETGITGEEFFYNIYQPPVTREEVCGITLKLDDELWAKKLEALKAMPSQTEKLMGLMGDYYEIVFKYEAFVLADKSKLAYL